MAYEIVFIKFKNEESVEFKSENVRNVFSKHGITEFGSPMYEYLRDGINIDMETLSLNDEVCTDFSISFRSVSEGLFELIHDLLKTDSLTALVVNNPTIPLVYREDSVNHIPQSIIEEHEAIVCNNANETAKAVLPGFTSWQKWAFA